MSAILAETIESSLEKYMQSDTFQETLKAEIDKFFTTESWNDLLYNSIQDALTQDDILTIKLEETIVNTLIPKIKKALESI